MLFAHRTPIPLLLPYQDEPQPTPPPVPPPTQPPVPSPTNPPVKPPTMPPVQPPTLPPTPKLTVDELIGIQTGPDVGPSYAGGMVYDSSTNSLFVTGATYGAFSGSETQPKAKSHCFFGVIDMPNMSWRQREVYGTGNVPEACSSILMNSVGGDSGALVIGSSENSGLLDGIGAASKDKQYGVLLDITQKAKYELVGGAVMGEQKSQNQFQFSIKQMIVLIACGAVVFTAFSRVPHITVFALSCVFLLAAEEWLRRHGFSKPR